MRTTLRAFTRQQGLLAGHPAKYRGHGRASRDWKVSGRCPGALDCPRHRNASRHRWDDGTAPVQSLNPSHDPACLPGMRGRGVDAPPPRHASESWHPSPTRKAKYNGQEMDPGFRRLGTSHVP